MNVVKIYKLFIVNTEQAKRRIMHMYTASEMMILL